MCSIWIPTVFSPRESRSYSFDERFSGLITDRINFEQRFRIAGMFRPKVEIGAAATASRVYHDGVVKVVIVEVHVGFVFVVGVTVSWRRIDSVVET